MTLIVGLKSWDCVVIGAEQEEGGGYTSKRSVNKLKLITGHDWAVVIGGAGDSALAENGMRDLERKLRARKTMNEQRLLDATDEILDSLYTKYVDKDPRSDGVSFIIGAISGNQLHLISTERRIPQVQDSVAYAGYGGDIGIFFMDRLHQEDADWTYTAMVAGFVIEQATQACRYCSGKPEIYVLQRPPNPRWRSLGAGDIPTEFANSFHFGEVARHLEKLVRSLRMVPESTYGYSDEHHPEEVEMNDLRPTIPMEFFPTAWLESPAYQQQIDEICSRNRDRFVVLPAKTGQPI